MNTPRLPLTEENIDKVLAEARDLLRVHSAEISDILEEYETRKVKVTIGIAIDATEPAPDFSISVRVPRKALNDATSAEGEDPDQERLPLEDGANVRGTTATVEIKTGGHTTGEIPLERFKKAVKKIKRANRFDDKAKPEVKSGE